MNSVVLMACRPCVPPAVVTSPITRSVRYGGSRSPSRCSQSMAFLNDPLTEPLYSGLLHTIPCAVAVASSNACAAGGGSMPGRYMGRSSSPTANNRVDAPALAAASKVIRSAARLVEPLRRDPPSPTTRTAGSMPASP
jgi:hypothetical protein